MAADYTAFAPLTQGGAREPFAASATASRDTAERHSSDCENLRVNGMQIESAGPQFELRSREPRVTTRSRWQIPRTGHTHSHSYVRISPRRNLGWNPGTLCEMSLLK